MLSLAIYLYVAWKIIDCPSVLQKSLSVLWEWWRCHQILGHKPRRVSKDHHLRLVPNGLKIIVVKPGWNTFHFFIYGVLKQKWAVVHLYWAVSSAWRRSVETVTGFVMSFIKVLNSNGLRRLPWGTPQRRGNKLELESLHLTLCLRSCKYDLISWRAGSCAPYAFDFVRSKLWQIQAKAFDRSMAATPTSFFKSRARLPSSVNLINAVA